MENKSGLRPLGRAVLIKPYTPERRESSIIIPSDTLEKDQMIEQRAVIIAVGANAWHDEFAPRAYPGDKVFVSKYAGFMAKGTLDGEQYRFINDRDIFAAIEEEANG